MTNENEIKRHLLANFEQFARRTRLQYIFHGNHKGKHPFHVKSNWIPPVQPSVALESYLENVKVRLDEITTQKPKYNLSRKEHIAVKELKHHTAINLRKADKGSTTVIPDQEMVYCSGSNSTSHMKTKGFCFQLPLSNIRRESAKMKFKSSQNCRHVI